MAARRRISGNIETAASLASSAANISGGGGSAGAK